MASSSKIVFSLATLQEKALAAIDPLLLEHRDMMYSRHLELPLSL